MRKIIKKALAMALTGALVIQPISATNGQKTVNAAGIADEFEIPVADDRERIGALVPYVRYDSMQASIGGDAVIATSPNFDLDNIASQASEQSYVRLPSSGSYAEWTVKRVNMWDRRYAMGRGVTMRFTMPDSGSTGLEGSVDVYVNEKKVKTVDLTSYYMWQYYSSYIPSDTDDGGIPCFAFDEVHFMLDIPLCVGDRIRIQSSGANGLEYGIDFIEIEDVPEPIEQPDNSVSVEDYGAYPDDGVDDLEAIKNAVKDADSRGMDVYFPAGTFHLGDVWNLGCSDMKITGAGMWHTNLQFTSDEPYGGGISGGNPEAGDGSVSDGYCKNLEFCNMYINSNLNSIYKKTAVYKCFSDVFGEGSVIHDIWQEHFECGFWFGDYEGELDYSDGVKVIDCRIRNNLNGGLYLCQGTSNATVYNCSVRNNCGDGLAMWNYNYMGAKDETGNVFAYNTIDLNWNENSIAIYGGDEIKVYNNYICDTFMASGIHLGTSYPGYGFANTRSIVVENNILVRTGCFKNAKYEEHGAIDIRGASGYDITFDNNKIYDAQHDGIYIDGSSTYFKNTKIFGAGVDGQEGNYEAMPHKGAAIRFDEEYAYIDFNGLQIANIAYTGTEAPYFITGNADGLRVYNVTIYDENTTYEIPSYPLPYYPIIDDKEETTKASVEINGYQISTTSEGFRTVYSVNDPDSEVVSVGMLYKIGDVAEADMVYGASGVYDFEATDAGKLDVAFSEYAEAQSYAMTMPFVKTASFYTSNMNVRAYAKLADDSYIYSDIGKLTVYHVADFLYQKLLMSNLEGHNYLFENILKAVDSSYVEKDFAWNNSVVKPSYIQ